MAPKCPKCGKSVYFAERQVVLGSDWHKTCVKCESCNKKLAPGNLSDREGKIYCKTCYSSAAGIKGYGFGASLDSYKSFGEGESELQGGDVPPETTPTNTNSSAPNFCAGCGAKNAGGNFCASCGTKF